MKTFTLEMPFANAPAIVLNEHEVHLVKAMRTGDLTKEQQQKLFEVIVCKICRLLGPSHAENPHDSARNEGMRLVGIYLNHIALTPYDQL